MAPTARPRPNRSDRFQAWPRRSLSPVERHRISAAPCPARRRPGSGAASWPTLTRSTPRRCAASTALGRHSHTCRRRTPMVRRNASRSESTRRHHVPAPALTIIGLQDREYRVAALTHDPDLARAWVVANAEHQRVAAGCGTGHDPGDGHDGTHCPSRTNPCSPHCVQSRLGVSVIAGHSPV